MTIQDLKDLCDKALNEGATDIEDISVEYGGDIFVGNSAVYRVEIIYKTSKGPSFMSSFHDLDEEEIEQIDFIRKNSGSPWP